VLPEVGGRLSDGVIDELLAGARSEVEIVGPGGVLARLTRRLVERALRVELSEHLGYEPHRELVGGRRARSRRPAARPDLGHGLRRGERLRLVVRRLPDREKQMAPMGIFGPLARL
jgi:hypothetical protein